MRDGKQVHYEPVTTRFRTNVDQDREPGDLFFVGGYADGEHLYVVLPNHGYWDIDSRCSNCDKPSDPTHRCWVRHGDPRTGEPVTVDKRGNTCGAGAGSIWMDDYHGFLRNGVLVSCV
jgi:hypothetical protein